MSVCRIMVAVSAKCPRKALVALVALCAAMGLTACARWQGGLTRAVSPTYTSFDDLLPVGITSIVYLPNVPLAKDRFRATELSKRLGEQTARGLWRRIDFFRPWVEVAFEQISDQVDEIVWGTYRAEGRESWFLVARVNQPARRVLERLHERTLPRVAEDLRPLEIAYQRYRGRRVYEWVKHEGTAARSLVSYALMGQVIVMGSDGAYVRRAIERRPARFQRWFGGHRREPVAGEGDSLRIALADFERTDDLYLWSRIEPNTATGGEAAPSRLSQIADRLRHILASNLAAASAGFRITPPAIVGRWRLDLARPMGEQAAAKGAFDFVSIAPSSAQALIALHDFPYAHPLFGELRSLLGKAMALEPFDQLRNRFRLMSLVPGIGDLPRIIGTLEGKVAYCSFPSESAGRMERCLIVALENPTIVASGLRAAPLLLRGIAQIEDYRGRPVLRLGEKVSGLEVEMVLAVVGSGLIVSSRADMIYRLVDAIERGETLDRQEVVRQLQRHRTDRILAEFYSAGSGRRLFGAEASSKTTAGAQQAAPFFLGDPRLGELASGRSYSICLQQPRGVEIVTCSTTGFHWSSATLGLAAIVLRSPLISGLFRPGVGKAMLE